jgi:hypothetical protein
MNKSYVTAVLTLTCLFGLGISARAQDPDAVVVKVPFEFIAGGATLPAGEYRVSRANPGVNQELTIRSYDKGSAFVLPLAFAQGTAERPTLDFENIGGRLFLSKIQTLDGVYTIATPRPMTNLAQMKNHGPASSSGGN